MKKEETTKVSYKNKKGEEVLFKDKADINHRTMSTYLSNFKLLADIMKSPDCYDINNWGLLNTTVSPSKTHNPNHNGCTGFGVTNSDKETEEKRICKCMHYYGKDMEKCKNECKLKTKWRNVGSIKILDYEVPTHNIIPTVGGIDLVLKDCWGKKYATEVKPQGNDESLVRMMAEAFTCIAAGGPKDHPFCSPAICFFEGSNQHKDILKPDIQENEDFQFLLNKVRVFCIKVKQQNGDVIDFEIV